MLQMDPTVQKRKAKEMKHKKTITMHAKQFTGTTLRQLPEEFCF